MRESNDQIRTLDQHSCESVDEQKQRRINADGLMGVKADSEPGSLPGNGGAFRAPHRIKPRMTSRQSMKPAI
jgi:hypothetical protein